ncbi:MAG: bifunctional diaminohydroxyphosphoribosylaminopyrimidine deaminase/5-amino-6-(5-phosphoribosylamino)uracil reductase RibD [Ignavibacteria bacterium]|jgi:diaminohydroxyphosphoribosylaminopyrimidine deaminase/5-amino-6-(5-phosphoribosylamino)uracil reductase
MKKDNSDEQFIKRCLELAFKGAGYTSPNPMVGCIIVKNGKILAEGFHKQFGADHAEINAINSALKRKKDLRGSSLYVNLEPCSHTGKTPPCTDRIIENRIGEVVIGTIDPNPLVNGKGIKKLKKAGIKVRTEVLEEECREFNKFYFKYIKTGLPYVTIKLAQTIDGKIADMEGNSKWISSPESRKYVHELRSRYDSVLIGKNTLEKDDPELTVRHFKGRNPYRIVIDRNLTTDLNKNLFSDGFTDRTIIISAEKADPFLDKIFGERRIRLIVSKLKDNKIDLKDALKKIGKVGITSVIIEGGAYTSTEFLEQGVADDLLIFIAPEIMGKGLSSFIPEKKIDLTKHKNINCKKIGKDILINIIL